jgi:hypothetical protein
MFGVLPRRRSIPRPGHLRATRPTVEGLEDRVLLYSATAAPTATATPSSSWFYGTQVNGGGGWTNGGIVGTYYAGNDFTGASFHRTDVRIDFPGTTVLPGGSLPTDPVFGAIGATNFSVRWAGNLIPKYTERYTLKIRGDDNLTLKINGSDVATATWSSGWVTADYSFIAGQSYAVSVTLVQGIGGWGARVHWLSTDAQPFAEEAIGPATPVGMNFTDNLNSTANGAMIGEYHAQIDSGVGPPVDAAGWPTGDFALSRMGDSSWGTGPSSFPNPRANDTITGVWTISFTGAAELYTNGRGQFLIGYDDGQDRAQVTLNNKIYYSYGNDLPISALNYDITTGTGYNSSTNTTVALFLLTADGDYQWHNVGFRDTDRSGNGTPAKGGTPAHDGLTDVSLMKPVGIGATTSYPPGTTFIEPYLATAAPYTVLRDPASSYDLDYNASVTSPYTDWSERSSPVFNAQASDHNQFSVGYMPWELKIMLANQTGKDLYINLPQTASGGDPAIDPDYRSSYLYQLAHLLKYGDTVDGVDYPGLLPNLNVYLEYGNENWNYWLTGPYGARSNVVHAIDAAKQHNTTDFQQYMAMGGWIQTDSTGAVTDGKTTLWTALRLKDASDIFRIVYGDAAMPGGPGGVNPDPRIRPTYEWQYGGGWNGERFSAFTALEMLQDHFGLQINKVFWGGGGAWYSDNNTPGNTADEVFSNITLATAIPPGGTSDPLQGDMDILAQFGLHHVGYEGGFDFGDGGNNSTDGQQQASNDARIEPYVRQTLDQYFQAGGSLPIAMLQTGGPYGYAMEWAVTDGIWDTPPYAPAPPKLQAYLDAQDDLPATPTYGPVVPNTNFNNPYGYRDGDRVNQTFRVTSYGTYAVGFQVWHDWTTASGTIQVLLDGAVVGSLTTPDANGGQSLWIPLPLAPGIHGLALVFSDESPAEGQIAIEYWGVKAVP